MSNLHNDGLQGLLTPEAKLKIYTRVAIINRRNLRENLQKIIFYLLKETKLIFFLKQRKKSLNFNPSNLKSSLYRYSLRTTRIPLLIDALMCKKIEFIYLYFHER